MAKAPVSLAPSYRSRKRDCDFPVASDEQWADPPDFRAALDLHMARHRDTAGGLARILTSKGCRVRAGTIKAWRTGICVPAPRNLPIVSALEVRWRLPPGYFKAKFMLPPRTGIGREGIDVARERGALAWHLPDDFDLRPPVEQEEILAWVRRVLVRGSTDYRLFHNTAQKTPYGIRFSSDRLVDPEARRPPVGTRTPCLKAPPLLAAEMEEVLAFKMPTLSPVGFVRRGTWKPVTARHKSAQFGLWFGALAADPSGPNAGAGVPLEDLTFGLLAMPQVWDWYLRWRERRRGFFTGWEIHLLEMVGSLAAPDTGWLAQSPSLSQRLRPIPGILTATEIAETQADWLGACGAMRRFALNKVRELRRAVRIHHDPFEPILPVLEAEEPVAEYDRIAQEILRRAPCESAHPLAAAEAARDFLMIRLSLHLGFRQKNLRQLLVCPRGSAHTPDGRLAAMGRGELRWSRNGEGWEVFVPAAAFKNSHSSFFERQPLRILLPDIGGLYPRLEGYVERHRAVLLGWAEDPGALFVKTVRTERTNAEFSRNDLFKAWQWIIQRYGVHNPYTGHGAIVGLLPHGPSAVRCVLATHVLKQTGSYDQASYAIQDTPQTIVKHYGRFFPRNKVAIAARVVNQVWS